MLRYPAYNWLYELEKSAEDEKNAPSAGYVGEPIARWTEVVPRVERVTTRATLAPLTKRAERDYVA